MKRSNRIEDYATIEAHCGQVPVYAFGYTYIYGVSPDLLPDVVLQDDNKNPKIKIQPKKSWEIKENKIGSTPAREPKTAANDDQPLLPVHLIDGDPETCWCSRGQIQTDVEDAWIRIDLPKEECVKSVTLVPHPRGLPDHDSERKTPDNVKAGQGFPKQLEIKLSRDAWHWETVYENRNLPSPEEMVPKEFKFGTRLAKQIWIIGREFPSVLNFGHCFSIAEVQVKDEKGNNLAEISKGAAVTVSSTHYGYGMDRFTQDMLWPIQYDLGFKWTRVGYDMGMFIWTYVEREKGVLKVDARADAAITESVENGVNVVMCLDKGNWLYAKQPRYGDRTRDLLETYYNWPPEPIESEEHLKGYLNYVRYMVRHFKDRVKYFEVWNEYQPYTLERAKKYCKIFKPAIKVIREEYPEAKIIMGSPAWCHNVPDRQRMRDFILTILREVGPIFDVVAWHPWYHGDPSSKEFIEYPEFVRDLKKECEALGFRGEYMATEWTWSAPYPPFAIQQAHPGVGNLIITEMQKAKYAARLTLTHLALDVCSFWNETFRQNMIDWSIGLLRNTFSASPLNPNQPEPIYYVFRTLSTVMDEASPLDIKVHFSAGMEKLEWYTFRKPNGQLMLAVWIRGLARDDDSQEVIAEITFPNMKLDSASVIDTFNGDTQRLTLAYDGNDTVLKSMHIKDWPTIITGIPASS